LSWLNFKQSVDRKDKQECETQHAFSTGRAAKITLCLSSGKLLINKPPPGEKTTVECPPTQTLELDRENNRAFYPRLNVAKEITAKIAVIKIVTIRLTTNEKP